MKKNKMKTGDSHSNRLHKNQIAAVATAAAATTAVYHLNAFGIESDCKIDTHK